MCHMGTYSNLRLEVLSPLAAKKISRIWAVTPLTILEPLFCFGVALLLFALTRASFVAIHGRVDLR